MSSAMVLEKEVRSLKREVQGLKSLLLELLDPDFGKELAEPVKARIRKSRKSGQFVSLESALSELRK